MRLVDLYWPVAQMVERLTVNQMVAGSSPAGSAILRGVAVVAYQPHKLVVAGSSPAPATNLIRMSIATMQIHEGVCERFGFAPENLNWGGKCHDSWSRQARF